MIDEASVIIATGMGIATKQLIHDHSLTFVSNSDTTGQLEFVI